MDCVAVAEAMDALAIKSPKKNRIQVSNTKKPLLFYLNLAKVPRSKIFYFYFIWIFEVYLDMYIVGLN